MTATMEDVVGNATTTMVAPVAPVAPTDLPIDMTFNTGHMVSIVFYPILMVISAVGNITVFAMLCRRRKKCRSRMDNMLLHLSIADLLVTFLMMPLEIAWNYTVDWRGGDALCRIMSFYRIFGLYLSSYVLVCISVDRYFAVLRPMQISDRRGRWMLVGAWVAAIVCSLPQVVVFQALTHPEFPTYVQCITKGTLTSTKAAVAYAAFGTVAIYIVPLSVIIFSYASILVEIFRRSRDPIDDKLRRSSLGFLGRAKIRTLKMTIIIVFVFFVCSTPYHVMMVWYWVDPSAAVNVDPRLQKGLLLFCSANSCMNPIVYGAFNIRKRRSTSTSQRPKNARLRALGVLRLVSWRRERDDDGGAGAGGAGLGGPAAASTGSSSEHAAHVLCHRGSRGSQGSEVSCTTEWSEVHSTSCLRQGVDSSVCSLSDAHDGGPQAHAQERAQGRLKGGDGSVSSVQVTFAEPAGGPRVRFPENDRFRLSQRSSSAPGIPSGAGAAPGLPAGMPAGPGAGPGLYGGRMFELRGNASGLARGAAAGARRNGCGRGKGAGRAGGAAGGAAEVTSSV
ncbi:gonadotropin-releasing hormone II receptor-like isoform X2 [Frankliniella occidentalis]|uniref:Gonadotropin-releasing hormone II receptor-like isoform X2 n=1 Tax=Frankliniella occidentalis TaxID=133901 RepID=A0A9C6X9Q0_FRAOC|nr:gonadotropin-releasing hormone II receptor-like isoform X2 [Frankliniella occidentalis]